MTARWERIAGALGSPESSREVEDLVASVGEEPEITEDPIAYHDPERHTRYYSFVNTGLVLGFRKGLLNHAHFYIEPHEGFRSYGGDLPAGIDPAASEKSILFQLGQPEQSGGGQVDDLLGYLSPWARYVRDGYFLHVEFGESERLRKVTLMRDDQTRRDLVASQ